MADDVVNNAEIPDELLYGRAGYLYALLFIRHYTDDDGTMIPVDVINRVLLQYFEILVWWYYCRDITV